MQHPGTNLSRLTIASRSTSWIAVSQSMVIVVDDGAGTAVVVDDVDDGGSIVVGVAIDFAAAVGIILTSLAFLVLVLVSGSNTDDLVLSPSLTTTSCKHFNNHVSIGTGKDRERSVRVSSP